MYRIVVVDDEIRIVEGLKKIISNMQIGCEVVAAFTDSEKAYRYMRERENEIDLLITDISMPELSGLELIEKAREYRPNLPCIILTGYEEFDYARKAVSLGVLRYLLKPVDIEELTQVISALVGPAEEVQHKHKYANLSKEVRCIKKEIECDFKTFDMSANAQKQGYSKEYLYRLFRKEMNIGVNEYLTEVRLEKARQYMTDSTNLKIYEACEMVGYEDPVYFSKIFKKKYGVLPKDYRKYALGEE